MSRRAWVVVALVVVAALGGCLGDEPAPGIGAREPTDGAGNTSGDAAPDAAPADTRGSAAAPDWPVGTWWTYRVTHSLFDAGEVTVVVAEVTPEAYHVGFADATSLATLPIHLPPVGELRRPDLAFWWHGTPASLLSFPLEDGKTWQGSFRGQSLAMTAELASEANGQSPIFHVTGRAEDGTRLVHATYDDGWKQLAYLAWGFDLDEAVVAELTLVTGGAGYQRDVLVPAMSDALVLGANGLDPNGPTPPSGPTHASFTITDATTHLVLAGFLGGGPGLHQLIWQPPEGGPIVVQQNNPPNSEALYMDVQVLDAGHVGGWQAATNAGGEGFVLAEAIAVTARTVAMS